MFVKRRDDPTLIKVVNSDDLIDPFKDTIQGKEEAGQLEQPAQDYKKAQLIFPSGESLPKCWVDPNYRNS